MAPSILPRTTFVSAERENGGWRAAVRGPGGDAEVTARAIVNAAGPWVLQLPRSRRRNARRQASSWSRAVTSSSSGSLTAITPTSCRTTTGASSSPAPTKREYTLIGTTDVALGDETQSCTVTNEEIDYLCRAANRYFNRADRRRRREVELLWREGFDRRRRRQPGRGSAATIGYGSTRGAGEAPLLSVLGGKITTYRRLAERALARLAPFFPGWDRPGRSRRICPAASCRRALRTRTAPRSRPAIRRLPPELIAALVAPTRRPDRAGSRKRQRHRGSGNRVRRPPLRPRNRLLRDRRMGENRRGRAVAANESRAPSRA